MKRAFLGWEKPFLQNVAEYLIKHHESHADAWSDMRDAVLVLPGGSATRRMMEVLLQEAEKSGKGLIPPGRIITVGELPKLIINRLALSGQLSDGEPNGVVLRNISALEQKLIWVEALEAVSSGELSTLSPGLSEGSFSSKLALAEKIASLYLELESGMLDFQDVRNTLQAMPDAIDEEKRWNVLDLVYVAYKEILTTRNLTDPCQNMLRVKNIVTNQDKSCSGNNNFHGKIWLIGTIDLSKKIQALLECVENDVASLVFAPESYSGHFDQFGSIVVSKWLGEKVDISDNNLRITDSFQEQVEPIMSFLAGLQHGYSTEDVAIACSDDSLVPYVRHALEAQQIKTRDGFGKRLNQTTPFCLLQRFFSYLLSGDYDSLVALLKHADLEDWFKYDHDITLDADFFEYFEKYQVTHLQSSYRNTRLPEDKFSTVLSLVQRKLKELAKGFTENVTENVTENITAQETKGLSYWCVESSRLLRSIYADRIDARDIELVKALEQIDGTLADIASVETPMQFPFASASGIILSELAKNVLHLPVDYEALNITGWLEVQLDDSPVLIVSGFNEGLIPEYVNSDSFLPDKLRHKLGLLDNDRRYARDVVALKSNLQVRKEVFLTCSRTLETGRALPSRLLFIGENQNIATRVQEFFQPVRQPEESVRVSVDLLSYLIKPKPVSDIKYVNITSLKDYLNCPYRFYLQHILKLKTAADIEESMSAPTFGSLMHDVLKAMATAQDMTNEDDIFRFLKQILDERYMQQFSTTAHPVTLLQKQVMEQRLETFSKWQAKRRRDGWIILENEFSVESEPLQGIILKGRIDRIDYHPESKKWVIIDYKTDDKAQSPEEKHCSGDKWTDLQLPAYRYVYRQMNQEALDVSTAYVCLSEVVPKTGSIFIEAGTSGRNAWTVESYSQAEDEIKRVVGAIAKQEFFPPNIDGSSRWLDSVLGIQSILEEAGDGDTMNE